MKPWRACRKVEGGWQAIHEDEGGVYWACSHAHEKQWEASGCGYEERQERIEKINREDALRFWKRGD